MEAGLVIVCSTIIGHWTQTKGGLKRIWCVCVFLYMCVCVCPPPPPLLLSPPCQCGVDGIAAGRAAPSLGRPVHLEDGALSAGLAPPPPHAGQGRAGLELHMEETNRDT